MPTENKQCSVWKSTKPYSLLKILKLNIYKANNVQSPSYSFFWNFFLNKGTVSAISSDPQCKVGDAWFTTVPLKALSDQVWIRYSCFCFFELFIFICGLSAKVTYAFLVNKLSYLQEWTPFELKKNDGIIPHIFLFSRLCFQGYRCKSESVIFVLRFTRN